MLIIIDYHHWRDFAKHEPSLTQRFWSCLTLAMQQLTSRHNARRLSSSRPWCADTWGYDMSLWFDITPISVDAKQVWAVQLCQPISKSDELHQWPSKSWQIRIWRRPKDYWRPHPISRYLMVLDFCCPYKPRLRKPWQQRQITVWYFKNIRTPICSVKYVNIRKKVKRKSNKKRHKSKWSTNKKHKVSICWLIVPLFLLDDCWLQTLSSNQPTKMVTSKVTKNEQWPFH